MSIKPEPSQLSDQAFIQVVSGVRDYAIYLLDAGGHVASWNSGAEMYKGYRANEIIGKHFSIFYTNEALSFGWPAHELEVASSTGRFEDEGWRVRKDGTRFWANVVLTPLRTDQGEVRGFLKICRDLTDRKQAQEKLRLSEERFRLMVEGVQDYAIFMLDPQGVVTTWNSGAERLKGYAAQEIIGSHFSRFYPAEEVARGWPEEELSRAGLEGRFEDEGWRLRKDGSRFWANVVITALRDDLGQLLGFSKVTRDLTARKEVEENARRFAREEAARKAAEEAAEARQKLVDELKAADQRKDEFLATLAHELRNPLAPLRSGLEVIKRIDLENQVIGQTRQMMERQLSHLVNLVDDLLDVSRVSRGKINLQKQRLTLKTVIEHAIEICQPLLQAADHQLILTIPEVPIWVEGDLTRLSQVLSNLLNNATKFTPPAGSLSIQARAEGDQAILEVSDNGVGIPTEMLPHVFELFTQVRRFQEHGQGGLGIGLSLVKHLVEMHGGGVSVHSEGNNRGSRFTITLPRVEPAPTAAPSPAPAPSAPGKLRVLVVDDNQDAVNMLATLIRLMKQEGHKASNGEQAVQLAEQLRPDLILMDIGMPRMNGHEACRKIRAHDWGKNIIMAALTGWGQDEDKALCIESGFDLHFVKPIDSNVLENLVQDLLQKKQAISPSAG